MSERANGNIKAAAERLIKLKVTLDGFVGFLINIAVNAQGAGDAWLVLLYLFSMVLSFPEKVA